MESINVKRKGADGVPREYMPSITYVECYGVGRYVITMCIPRVARTHGPLVQPWHRSEMNTNTSPLHLVALNLRYLKGPGPDPCS